MTPTRSTVPGRINGVGARRKWLGLASSAGLFFAASFLCLSGCRGVEGKVSGEAHPHQGTVKASGIGYAYERGLIVRVSTLAYNLFFASVPLALHAAVEGMVLHGDGGHHQAGHVRYSNTWYCSSPQT